MFVVEDLRKLAKAEPFVPLRITTSAGEHFDVTHPDLVMIGARHVIVGQASRRHPGIFDGEDRVAVMHITSVTDLPVEAAANGNGNGHAAEPPGGDA